MVCGKAGAVYKSLLKFVHATINIWYYYDKYLLKGLQIQLLFYKT